MKHLTTLLCCALFFAGCDRERSNEETIFDPIDNRLEVVSIRASATELEVGDMTLVRLVLNSHEGVSYDWSVDYGVVLGIGRNVKYRASLASPEFTTIRCLVRQEETGDSVEAAITLHIIR